MKRRKEKGKDLLVSGLLRHGMREGPWGLERDVDWDREREWMEREPPPARGREREKPAGGGGGVLNDLNPMVRDTQCELCGDMFSHPVTYHMREAHPGCGRHAGGQGYNSGGNFCGGWAGNCGDGGVGGSTWYLMCDRCRDKYLRDKKQAAKDKMKKKLKKKVVTVKQASPAADISEPHLIMKNNALFLLSLASSAGCQYSTTQPNTGLQYGGAAAAVGSMAGLMKHRNVRLDSSLPSVNEDMLYDVNAFPAVPFSYLTLRGAHVSRHFLYWRSFSLVAKGAHVKQPLASSWRSCRLGLTYHRHAVLI